MGVFFTSHQPVVPEVNSAIKVALMVDPNSLGDVEQEASQRTIALIRATSPQFNPSRFLTALLIAGALLWGGIWAAQHNLPDISTDLMDSFMGFSGLVLGLLGSEAQRFSSA
jgi:hypothetical protein